MDNPQIFINTISKIAYMNQVAKYSSHLKVLRRYNGHRTLSHAQIKGMIANSAQ